jgi:hypothetical protein
MLVTYEVAIKPGTALRVVNLVDQILAEPRRFEGWKDPGVGGNRRATLFIYERWESPELLEAFLTCVKPISARTCSKKAVSRRNSNPTHVQGAMTHRAIDQRADVSPLHMGV